MSEAILEGQVMSGDNAPAKLPGTFTETSYQLPIGLDYEEWERIGAALQEEEYNTSQYLTMLRWWIGDWLAYGEHTYGEKYAQAAQRSNHQYSEGTLANMQWVSKKVDFSHRCEKLNWGHHQEVAPLPPEEQAKILQDADKNNLSRRDVKKLIQHRKTERLQEEAARDYKEKYDPPIVTHASYESWLPQQEIADLLLTDPPYSTDVPDIRQFAQDWLPMALDRVKDNGRAYVCIGAYPAELAAYLAVDTGDFELSDILVWTYKNTLGPLPKFTYKLNWQAILHFRGPGAPPLNCPIMTEQFTVHELNAPDGRLGDRFHAWQKPDILAERLIRHSTQSGDLVIDPFVCTGTFVLAANKLGRMGIGCDIDEKCLEIAESRGCRRQ